MPGRNAGRRAARLVEGGPPVEQVELRCGQGESGTARQPGSHGHLLAGPQRAVAGGRCLRQRGLEPVGATRTHQHEAQRRDLGLTAFEDNQASVPGRAAPVHVPVVVAVPPLAHAVRLGAGSADRAALRAVRLSPRRSPHCRRPAAPGGSSPAPRRSGEGGLARVRRTGSTSSPPAWPRPSRGTAPGGGSGCAPTPPATRTRRTPSCPPVHWCARAGSPGLSSGDPGCSPAGWPRAPRRRPPVARAPRSPSGR